MAFDVMQRMEEVALREFGLDSFECGRVVRGVFLDPHETPPRAEARNPGGAASHVGIKHGFPFGDLQAIHAEDHEPDRLLRRVAAGRAIAIRAFFAFDQASVPELPMGHGVSLVVCPCEVHLREVRPHVRQMLIPHDPMARGWQLVREVDCSPQ